MADDPRAIEAPTQNAEPPPRRRVVTQRLAILLIACVLVAGGAWSYLASRNIASTDDAQIDGNAIAIVPKDAGYIVQLAIRDNQPVRRGDLLVRIDPRDYLAARAQAEASLVSAQAQLENAKVGLAMAGVSGPAKLVQARAEVQLAAANRDLAAADFRRQVALDFASTTQQAKDRATQQLRSAQATLLSDEAQADIAGQVQQTIAQAQASVDQAQAQLGEAQAQLATADLNLSNTELRAPQDGTVTLRNVQLGSYVQPGQSLFSLVTSDMWVTANFKESQLDRMRVGQKVAIRIDAYRHLRLQGHIDSIQIGTGSRFSAFPSENATGNFVKIVQRVPVKILIDSGIDPNLPLPLGASADPSVQLQ